MFTDALVLAVLGVLALVVTTLAWFRQVSRVAIPDNRMVFLVLWVVAGALGAASFFSSGSGWLSGVFGAVATLGGLGLLVLYALRKQGAGEAISVGDQIPGFTALDVEGSTFDSAALSGPTLIKFFRGHW